MGADDWRRNTIYRAIQLTRRHSRECRCLDARELLLAVERGLLRAAAADGLCQGVEDCSIAGTCPSRSFGCGSSGTLLRMAS